MDFKKHYLDYKTLVDAHLETIARDRGPASLYEPTHYVLSGGGKRIRAILVMLAAEAVGGDGRAALGAGVGVEILHNFTLVHDDIMDSAATRRGRATVHTRWDDGTAILVGDVMIGLAHHALLSTPSDRIREALHAFTNGIVDVCEGQALDREFESRPDVTLADYMHMIAMKTGRLVETAAEVGGLVGNGTPEQIAGLRAYARHIGQAFQIQDDLLDITAAEAEFGKRIGGDIIEGKKTYLVVRALERVHEGADRALLDTFRAGKGLPAEQVPAMRDLYERHGVLDAARDDVRHYIDIAKADLGSLADTPARDMLVWFAHMLMNRNN
jgi:geranylgeranyl diphosphate synthase, type II